MRTSVVRFMMDSSRPSGRVIVSCGKSISTSCGQRQANGIEKQWRKP